jgi:hypothetical protein
MKGDREALAAAEEEQRKRARSSGAPAADPGGVLPDVRAGRLASREG